MNDKMTNCCANPKVKDLSQGLGEKHLFCASCRSHLWEGRQYTKREWSEFVESESKG